MSLLLAIMLIGRLPQEEPEQQSAHVRARVEYLQANLRGLWISDDAPAGVGDQLHLHRDLDLENPEGVFAWRIGVAPPASKAVETWIDFTYWARRWEGNAVFDNAEFFDHTTIPAGTPVHSVLGIEYYAIEARVDLPRSDHNFRLGGVVGLQLVRFPLELDWPTGHGRVTGGDLLAEVGLHAEWCPVPWLFAGASVAVSEGFGSTLWDLAAYAGGGHGPVHIEVGYRYFVFDGNADSAMYLSMSGPYVGITVRF